MVSILLNEITPIYEIQTNRTLQMLSLPSLKPIFRQRTNLIFCTKGLVSLRIVLDHNGEKQKQSAVLSLAIS